MNIVESKRYGIGVDRVFYIPRDTGLKSCIVNRGKSLALSALLREILP